MCTVSGERVVELFAGPSACDFIRRAYEADDFVKVPLTNDDVYDDSDDGEKLRGSSVF